MRRGPAAGIAAGAVETTALNAATHLDVSPRAAGAATGQPPGAGHSRAGPSSEGRCC